LNEFPEHGCLIGDYCLPRMRRGEPIDTCRIDGSWWDIGTPASYLRANLDWLKRNASGAASTELASFRGPGARVEDGVHLASSVVGAGAVLTGRGLIESCVIWPGSVVAAPLSRAVVTPRGVVRVDDAT
jgi:NDP-sugar pyrophosphorylase family protein